MSACVNISLVCLKPSQSCLGNKTHKHTHTHTHTHTTHTHNTQHTHTHTQHTHTPHTTPQHKTHTTHTTHTHCLERKTFIWKKALNCCGVESSNFLETFCSFYEFCPTPSNYPEQAPTNQITPANWRTSIIPYQPVRFVHSCVIRPCGDE